MCWSTFFLLCVTLPGLNRTCLFRNILSTFGEIIFYDNLADNLLYCCHMCDSRQLPPFVRYSFSVNCWWDLFSNQLGLTLWSILSEKLVKSFYSCFHVWCDHMYCDVVKPSCFFSFFKLLYFSTTVECLVLISSFTWFSIISGGLFRTSLKCSLHLKLDASSFWWIFLFKVCHYFYFVYCRVVW